MGKFYNIHHILHNIYFNEKSVSNIETLKPAYNTYKDTENIRTRTYYKDFSYVDEIDTNWKSQP